MATVPLSGSNIRLISDIPFSSDYKNTRWFDTVTQQTTYFEAKPVVHQMTQASFQRVEGRTFIAVNKSVDDLWGTNYVRFQNPTYGSKWFYAFVTKIEFKQINTTYVYFQMDVFQTWKFSMNFKPSFVIREHAKLWNTDGTPVINTVDEGLNYGSEYDTVAVEQYRPYDQLQFLVIITKAPMHNDVNDNVNKVTPIMNGMPQSLSYYIHPFKLGGNPVNLTIGGTVRELDPILDVLKGVAVQDDAVNNVIAMYITDYIGMNGTYDSGTNMLTLNATNFINANITDNDNVTVRTINVLKLGTYVAIGKTFVDKYKDYHAVTESKLLMHPYTTLLMDDAKGSRAIFKNEYILSKDIEISTRGSMGVSNKVMYSITDYLTKSDLDFGDALISSLEHSVISNVASDVPVISDYLSAFLQGNRNSIETQRNSIAFNAGTALAGATVGGLASAATGNIAGVASSGVGLAQGAGDAVLAIQAIESKQKDISNTPPQLSKMGSNTHFDYGNNITGVYLIKRQIKSEYRRKLTDFFNMFGYKMNEVKVPNFHTRSKWNYVQTLSCTILGNFNNEDLQDLKNVFDRGITLWHTDDVGNYDLENEVI